MKKQMTKAIAVFLCLLMLATTVPLAFAEEPTSVPASEPVSEPNDPDTPTSGQCGDNVYWSYDEDTATLTISGEGEMDYFSPYPWATFQEELEALVIEYGVTNISAESFYGFDCLAEVTISESVTSIGYRAFMGCESLMAITIPNSVVSIECGAFERCSDLTFVTIPASVTSLETPVFAECSNLKNISVDKNNQVYASDETGCLYTKDKTVLLEYPIGNERTSFRIPDGVIRIGDDSFYSCVGLEALTIPDSVVSIGMSAFFGCSSLASVTMGDGVTSIGDYAFSRTGLRKAVIPQGVSELNNTFSECYCLESVTIPASVEYLDDHTFFRCGALRTVLVDENNPYYMADENGDLFNKDKTVLIHFASGNTRERYSIPDGVTSFAEYAFWGCQNMYDLTIPASVTAITNYSLVDFELQKVTILNPNCAIDPDEGIDVTIEESAIICSYPGSTAQAYAETYGRTFVALCPTDHANTTEVPEQPATCTENGYTAGVYCNDCEQWIEGHELIKAGHKDENGDFICDVCGESTLYTIHVDETLNVAVDGIQKSYIAFAPDETGYYMLTSASEEDTYGYLYDSELNLLDENDDAGADSNFLLVHEMTAGETYYYGVRFFDESVAGNFDVTLTKESVYSGPCGDNATWTLIPSSGELCIEGEGALWEDSVETNIAPWNDHMKEINSVRMEDGITNIPANAFFGAIHLTWLSLPDTLKTVGQDAFFLCTRLRSVYLPDGIETIACNAFQGCTSLQEIYIPDSVRSIDVAAFANCPSLYEIVLPEGLTTLEGGLFIGDYRLNTVILPASLTTINGSGIESPFTYCYNLERIENRSEKAVAAATGFHTFAFPEEVDESVYLNYLAISAEMQLLQTAEVLSGSDLQSEIMTRLEEVVGTDYQETLEQIAALDPVTPVEGMPESLTFYGFSDSAEQAYCKENNIPFVLLDQGQCGDNVYWSYASGTATLTITGTGAMWDSEAYDGWSSYRNIIQTVVIEDGVTSIGNETFQFCTNLTHIIIPNSVKSIDENAFFYCNSLTSVTIPRGVSSIREGAFRCCSALESIEVDADNLYYSSDASGCLYNKDKTELLQYPIGNERKEFSVPEGVKVIGLYAFQLAEKLEKAILPDGLETISGAAFYLCTQMTEINIPETVTVLGEGAFYECRSLTSIVIPSGVTRLDYYLFAFCCNLVSLTIPDSVTYIEQRVFFPGNAEGVESFMLTDIYYLGTEAQWNAIEIDDYENDPLLNATIHFIVTDDTNVSLSYEKDVFDPSVEIDISEIPTGDKNSRAWSITPTLNGEKVQPNGRVQVKLPIPTGWDKTKIVLTHTKANGAVEYPEFTIEGDFVVFWAEEFSTYALELQKPHVHTYDNGVITKEATCMEEGVMTYTCTTCNVDVEGHIKTESIEKNSANHATYGTVVNDKLDATCTDKGYTGNTVCEGCGSTISNGSEIPALGHTSPDKHGNCERCGEHIQDVCKWCGKQHKGFFQGIIGFFHKILAAIFDAKY